MQLVFGRGISAFLADWKLPHCRDMDNDTAKLSGSTGYQFNANVTDTSSSVTGPSSG